MLFCTRILKRTNRFMLTCHWDFPRMARMERKCGLKLKNILWATLKSLSILKDIMVKLKACGLEQSKFDP
jgi:hypothetical protein